MGKRKHSDKEEHIARKIKKLERKMAKVRRRRRRDSSSSFSTEPSAERSEGLYEDMDGVLSPEVQQIEEPLHKDTDPASEPEQPQPITELDPSILSILGDEPAKEDIFGSNVHKDIASRWSDILVNGLKDDTRKEVLKLYNIPENMKLAQAPLLNPEIKAAVNDNAIKRDCILTEKQKQLACVLTCIAEAMSSILMAEGKDTNDCSHILKWLSDAGRLLCHIHHTETATRKNFLLTCLNKEVKDNIKDLKRDHLLFGTDLSEKLKSMKAIARTGVEMRPAAAKAKVPPKGKQPEPSTSRTLNWRGPPPPPPPAPRRGYVRPSSTAGGRKQQPTTRRANDRRAFRPSNRNPRR